MNARPLLAAAIFAALTPAVVLGTVGVAFVMWIGDVNRAKCAANARTRVYCSALHWDDETCPRCCPEVALAEECCGCTWSPAQLIATYGRAMKAERDAALAEIARLRAAVEAVLADHFADSGGQWKEIRAEAIRAALTPGTEQ